MVLWMTPQEFNDQIMPLWLLYLLVGGLVFAVVFGWK